MIDDSTQTWSLSLQTWSLLLLTPCGADGIRYYSGRKEHCEGPAAALGDHDMRGRSNGSAVCLAITREDGFVSIEGAAESSSLLTEAFALRGVCGDETVVKPPRPLASELHSSKSANNIVAGRGRWRCS